MSVWTKVVAVAVSAMIGTDGYLTLKEISSL